MLNMVDEGEFSGRALPVFGSRSLLGSLSNFPSRPITLPTRFSEGITVTVI